MAKVIGPLHSAEARGRMAGLIFNTWRGIATVKAFCSPAQPRTSLQLQIRAWATQLVRGWAALTDANRLLWNNYAIDHPDTDWTGNPKRLTGLNWYVRCGVRILQSGGTLVDTAPITPAPDAVADFIPSGAVLSISCAYTPYGGTDTQLDVWLYGPHSPGIQGKLERARHNVFADGETISPLVILDLTVGHYTVFARGLDEVTGLASPWVSGTADVTAV